MFAMCIAFEPFDHSTFQRMYVSNPCSITVYIYIYRCISMPRRNACDGTYSSKIRRIHKKKKIRDSTWTDPVEKGYCFYSLSIHGSCDNNRSFSWIP